MKIQLLASPYDTGKRDVRMGRGPARIVEAGVVDRLKSRGHSVEVKPVEVSLDFPGEVETAFAVMAALSTEVAVARRAGKFPIVLAGNCNTTVGTVAGLAPGPAGVLWFDGHGDFETPDTTTSGFVDGMGIAILAGHCWRRMAAGVPGYTPVPEARIILAGASDVEPHEMERLRSSGVTYFSDRDLVPDEGDTLLAAAVDRIANGAMGIHVHIDLDVHDPKIARANHYMPPGGLTPDRLRALVAVAAGRVPVLSAAITAYDPDVDLDGVACASALELAGTLADGVASRSPDPDPKPKSG